MEDSVFRNTRIESVRFSGNIYGFGLGIEEIRAIIDNMVKGGTMIKNAEVLHASDEAPNRYRVYLDVHPIGRYDSTDVKTLKETFEGFLKKVEQKCQEYAKFKEIREIERSIISTREILEKYRIPMI